MSEDRTLMIYAEGRRFNIYDPRVEFVYLESREFHVPDEERELEVYLP